MTSLRSTESLNSVDTMAMAMSPGASQLLQEIQTLRYTIQRNESEMSKNQFALSDARAMTDDLRVLPPPPPSPSPPSLTFLLFTSLSCPK
jgi:hypothetical protein